MKLIRFIVGRILLLLNMVFKPKALPRTDAELIQLTQAAEGLSLYQFEACPFCIKVRRALVRLGVTIPIHDVKRSPQHERELIERGGKRKVPCLRIVDEAGAETWLYQSSVIIEYLESRFTDVKMAA